LTGSNLGTQKINKGLPPVNPWGAELSESLNHICIDLVLPVLVDWVVKSVGEIFVGSINQD
jgi:hypothetical protein